MGMEAYMFMNNEQGKCMKTDLFLLPNQMLSEDWHLAANDNFLGK